MSGKTTHFLTDTLSFVIMTYMHVALDFTPVVFARGVSRYTYNLAYSLANQPEISQLSLLGYSWGGFEYLNRSAKSIKNLDPEIVQLALSHVPQKYVELAWRFGFWNVKKQLDRPQVFHAWDWHMPPDKELCVVSTVHDLAMLRFPETAHPTVLAHHQRTWEYFRKNQCHLIAVSAATKRDIIELLGIPAYLIHVIPEALPREVRATAQNMTEEQYEQISKELRLLRPFVLFVGTREPRKNLMRLIEAWYPLRREFDLLIAGESGWDETAKLKKIPELRFLGKVSDEQLSVLYSEATCFAYPSLYEGFGLPILEAFQYGTPVLTSNTSSMPEVAGNAAILVDPFSVDSIHQGLRTLLNEPLAEQKVRLQKMIIRQHMFTWEQVAQQTVEVYEKAYADFSS